jgi:hypothetical protein
MAGETLRVLNGAGAGGQIPLNGEFVVGRSEGGMGNLAGDTEISRRHARFQFTQSGQVLIEDLGSTNGTHVNGQRLEGPRVLAPGDQITLGKTILQFDAQPAAAPPAPPVPPAPQPFAAAAAPPPQPIAPAAYGAGQGFAGGPVSGPPPGVATSQRRWLPFAAIALAVLIIAGAVVAVIANTGSDNSKQAASQSAATPAPSTPAPSTPAPSAPAPTSSVRSVPALEASLKSVLSGASTSGPRVTAVSCPSNAPSAAGSTFACQVAGQQGLAGAVTVTLKDSQRKAYKFKAVLHGNGFTRTVSGTAG